MTPRQKSQGLVGDSTKPKALRSRRVAAAISSRVESATRSQVIMLFGRRDEPTDAVRDYASHLSQALRTRGIACEDAEMRWYEDGWLRALYALGDESGKWRGRWVVLHYTALMWSQRAFPLCLPVILLILRARGCRTAVVFHDVYAAAGSRWIDRLRVALQERIMRHLSKKAHRAVIPVFPQGVPWLRKQKAKIEFIPVGANIPSLDELMREEFVPVHDAIPTVAVFGIPTWPPAQRREVEAIVQSVRKACAHLGRLQLLVLGRGAREAESLLRSGLAGTDVNLRVAGLLSGREISSELSSADAMLFARGPLSSRRGSGVAAIACGLPIVAYRGVETGYPLMDAGILFVPQDDADALGDALAGVLSDPELRSAMRERNLRVFREWFSWGRIAERWIDALEIGVKDSSKCLELQSTC